MKEELKKRLIDLAFLIAVAAMAFYGYRTWNVMKAHDALEDRLLSILNAQVEQQERNIEFACEARGYEKAEEEGEGEPDSSEGQ